MAASPADTGAALQRYLQPWSCNKHLLLMVVPPCMQGANEHTVLLFPTGLVRVSQPWRAV